MDSTVEITGAAHGGYGVCRIEGQVCFVPYALPGDTIRLRIARQTKGVLWGAVEEVLEPSPSRCAAECPTFGVCGGCTWLHFAYPAQGDWKRRIVGDCLKRIAGIEAEVEWHEDPALRLDYRTRAEFHSDEGKLGFYAQGTHAVVDIERCPLCHERLNEALERLRGLPVKDAVEVVVHPENGDTMVWTKRRQRAVAEAFEHTNASEDEKPRHFLFDGVPIVNGAFSQASLLLNRILVRVVREMAGTPARLLDLYCGSGNLSIHVSAASSSMQILGLDHQGTAIQAARATGRGTYRAGDERAFAKALEEPWDVVLLDPPRTGAKAIVEALASSSAQRIVYVSCDPATLARDLKGLVARGWRLTRTAAVDLFPNTAHVETVCCLDR